MKLLYFSGYMNGLDQGENILSEAQMLSEILRRHAIQRGISIDHTYRNENGIVMQLESVQDLFTQGNRSDIVVSHHHAVKPANVSLRGQGLDSMMLRDNSVFKRFQVSFQCPE